MEAKVARRRTTTMTVGGRLGGVMRKQRREEVTEKSKVSLICMGNTPAADN